MSILRSFRSKDRDEVVRLITGLEARFKGVFGEGVDIQETSLMVHTLLQQRRNELIKSAFQDETTETLLVCFEELQRLVQTGIIPVPTTLELGGDKETVRDAIVIPKPKIKRRKGTSRRRKST